MNDLEKKSFYSFLGLYIISSFLFLVMIGYWYYTAQKNALENEMHYKLQHISDVKAGDIIMAHMRGTVLHQMQLPTDITLALISTDGKVVEGRLLLDGIPNKSGYLHHNGYEIFVSDAPREHLNIKYVVAQSHALNQSLKHLRQGVFWVMGVIAVLLCVIAWRLSRLFMKPLRQKVEQIEQFINDVTHELNTPITSLSMATNQALKSDKCTQKTLKNISISTRQLYDIYRSLTYLNFSNTQDAPKILDLKDILEASIAYYRPLAEVKEIDFDTYLEPTGYEIDQAEATLLFGNLIGNAIKYSHARSTIRIRLKDNVFSIQDEGIGIEKSKQKEIFEKFKRGTAYSGGFGVGLSIVRGICDKYGIEMQLESEIEQGSSFILSF